MADKVPLPNNQAIIPVQRLPNFVGPPDGRANSMLSPAIGMLVADVCAELEPLPVILKRYSVSKSQFRALLAQPVFRQAIKAQRSVFQSVANIPDRIRLKAQLAVEDLIQDMYSLAAGVNVQAAARVAAFNAIKNMTGLERPEAPVPKQKFALTINVSAASAAGVGSADRSSAEIIEEIHEGVAAAAEEAEVDMEKIVVAGGWNSGVARPVGEMKHPPAPVNIIRGASATGQSATGLR